MITNDPTNGQCLTTEVVRHSSGRSQLVRRQIGANTRPRVSTWLAVSERDLVAAAGFERFATVHRDSIHAVFEDFRNDRADAAIFSIARVSEARGGQLSELARGFPGRPLIAIALGVDDATILASTLELGRDGVELVVDARSAKGWHRLREALSSPRIMESFRVQALGRIQAEVGALTASCAKFFDLIFDPAVSKTKQIAQQLGVGRSAFHSRFHRASLPSARRYLDFARLVRVAFIGQEPALTGTDIANRVHASSLQSLHRSIRCLTGLSFREFRYRYDGAAMLNRFVNQLVTPNVERLKSFDPRRTGHRQSTNCSEGARARTDVVE
jgi:AraC-like DNA-binding protein